MRKRMQPSNEQYVANCLSLYNARKKAKAAKSFLFLSLLASPRKLDSKVSEIDKGLSASSSDHLHSYVILPLTL